MTLTINHFGPFYLTYLLIDRVTKANQGRIINVSSALHNLARDNCLEDLGCDNKSFSSMQQYFDSKFFNVLFTVGLDNLLRRNKITNVKVAAVHPGAVDTDLYGDSFFSKCFKTLCCCFVRKKEAGAKSVTLIASAPFNQILSGEYYDQNGKWK